MLTELEERAIIWTCYWTCRLAIIPCDWDNETLRLNRTKSIFKKWFEGFNGFYVLFYVSYELFCFPFTIERFNVTRKSGMLMFHCLVFLRDLANLGLRINSYLYMDDINLLFNQTLLINKNLGRSVLKQDNLPQQIREFFFIGCQIILCAAGLFLYSVFFIKPDAPNYLYSVINPDYRNPFVFIIFACLEILLSTNVILVGINFLVLFVHLFSMNFWLKKICIEWPEQSTIRTISSIRIYRSLYILNRIYNQTYSKLVVPGLKYIMSCAAMITFFSGVSNYNVKSIEANLCVFIAFACYFQLLPGAYIMSNLHKYSSQYKHSILQYSISKLIKNNKKYCLQFLISCAPIRCKIGSVYYMEQKSKAALFDWLVNGTIFLFLTYKK